MNRENSNLKKRKEIVQEKIKIAAADDDFNFRLLLSEAIKKFDNYELVGIADNGLAVLPLIKEHKPHIALIDINMPEMNGILTTEWIKDLYPETNVIGFSSHNDSKVQKEMFTAGAKGYLDKRMIMAELNLAIACVMSGNDYVSRSALVQRKVNYIDITALIDIKPLDKEIMILTANGFTSKEISKTLHLSYKTIESHQSQLMKKFGFKNKAELIKYVAENFPS